MADGNETRDMVLVATAVRQALLSIVDVIERVLLKMDTTTADIRKMYKAGKLGR